MKITESNCWVLLDPEGGKTILWSTWRYVNTSNSCWPYGQKCRCNPCAGYTMPRFEASQLVCCHHKNSLLLVAGPCQSACKRLICLSKLMRSNFPSSSPLYRSLSISVFFGPKSEGMSLLLGCTVPHECIFHLSKSSESLGDEKEIVHKQFVS